ncbi:hypothetical protein PHYSODRAFT_510538 [Phytophthora sojae]|uniref:Reverse transcriptase RNase H-like domain-containing protein n=1 Tax=Phytophthora sojae (strain P6497) TaxID=1094619 RepID=G4ZR32_PHYSP|nr:hypothetical protein PHYSODRAFT_510538 [Phytophthora sojae]EGZ14112.1 hypothetical protein PHYSODRAFT_510538 [Phytophthora sojae]|eukprot:XP_009531541.1 hypothetical protein PHYSODRAFT_510538 [Phytophthora sojae]
MIQLEWRRWSRFLCRIILLSRSTNWRRDYVVDYGRAVAPLQAKFDEAMKDHSRRKRHAACVSILHLRLAGGQIWEDPTLEDWPDNDFRLFCGDLGNDSTDASDRDWAVILTQVNNWKEGIPVHEQSHELLVCKGGSFKASQLQWSVVEKEAYPVVYAVSELETCCSDRWASAFTLIMRT